MDGDALTTVDSIKSRLGITASTFDTLLGNMIAAVTARFEQIAGRRFTQGTFTDELHDGSDAWGSVRNVLIVKNAPVQTLTSFQYDIGFTGNPDWIDYPITLCRVDYDKGLIYVPAGLPQGYQNVRITYDGGFATMPADLVELCEEVVTRIFKKRESEGRDSETFNTNTVVWSKQLIGDDERATIKNYRRGYNL